MLLPMEISANMGVERAARGVGVLRQILLNKPDLCTVLSSHCTTLQVGGFKHCFLLLIHREACAL